MSIPIICTYSVSKRYVTNKTRLFIYYSKLKEQLILAGVSIIYIYDIPLSRVLMIGIEIEDDEEKRNEEEN